MKQTLTEKILARASGRERVEPGENVWVDVDVLLTHDVCGPGTIGIFEREFGPDAPVFDREKVVILPDHYIYTRDVKAHRNVETLREFARRHALPHFYDPGTPSYRGVCHVALPQEGHVRPGEVVIGTDSHTCSHGAFGAFATGVGNTDAAFVLGAGKILLKVPPTLRFELTGSKPDFVTAKDMILRIIGDIGVDGATYAAMEFTGEAVDALSVDERITIANMAIEAGAKNGIMAPDEKTLEYVRGRTVKPFDPLWGDPGATVREVFRYDVSTFVPCVARPHLPSRYAAARDCRDVRLTRVYIGSCTGGKLEDFVMAASILKGGRVAVETCLVPATTEVAMGLMSTQIGGRSLLEIFSEAGCVDIAPPSCAACLGGPVDTFGRSRDGDVVLSTTNRNFIGRMGSKDAQVYLASPLTAAASALRGRITDPRDL